MGMWVALYNSSGGPVAQGQSTRLITGWLEVRLLPGPPRLATPTAGTSPCAAILARCAMCSSCAASPGTRGACCCTWYGCGSMLPEVTGPPRCCKMIWMAVDEVLEQVRQALAEYAPRHIEDAAAMPAAVLILVYERNGEAHVLFTERTDQVEHHKGQVSFPGGASDDNDDSLEKTALRETYEEIGVRAEAPSRTLQRCSSSDLGH